MSRHPVARTIVHRLKLFGGAVVEADHIPVTGRASQRHRIALLALLATTRRLYRSRDQLVFFLWPDADVERGRRLLSDSIYRINQALGGNVIAGTGDDVRLNRSQLSSDVADFESAVEAQEWTRVAELHTGPFLDGFYLPNATDFDQWMENERAQYARTAAKALELLAVDARDAGRVAEAADWWQRLSSLAPDNSRVAMELMRALEASGNRAGALRHARAHTLQLRETLGMEPDRAVHELAEQIAKRSESPAVPARGDSAPGADSDAGSANASTSPAVPAAAPAAGNTNGTAVSEGTATISTGSSIAVLPFKNLSDSDHNTYFADGMAEELMYLLTRTPGLRVASPTSAFAYRDMRLDVREMARRLQVDWILEGSVRRSGDKLRIVVQLTDASNGYQVWSALFDRTSHDVFAIQADIAVAIVNCLAPALGASAGTISRLDARSTPDAFTYDLYLQARFHWHRRTEMSLLASAQLFEQVVARAPDYARAWAGLADTYAVLAFYDHLAPRVAFPAAEAAARRAIQLDPSLAAPYATLAYVDTYFHWNWSSAEHGYRRAIDLEPTYSTAHQWYANLLTARGRFEEAEREMRRAAELDPLSMVAHAAIGWVLIFANQIDRAIEQFDGGLKLQEHFCLAHYWRGMAFASRNEPLLAIPCFERVLELSHGSTRDSALALAALAHSHATAGHLDTARDILGALLRQESNGHYISSFEVAKVYLALGDVASTLARLERAHADRAHSMAFLRNDSHLQAIAGEPRFQRLVELVEQAHAESPDGLLIRAA